ncbi:hypothetical protein Hanom_Chr11g00974591 [Helianthus anomalus]
MQEFSFSLIICNQYSSLFWVDTFGMIKLEKINLRKKYSIILKHYIVYNFSR